MKNTKNNITELVFILDCSGSMAGFEADTLGGFNSLIEKQRREIGTCLVTTVLFSNRSARIHDRIPLSEVAPLTDKEYSAYGCTALYDAVGSTIRHISHIHKYARPEDVPDKTVFVITTDGMENASKYYSGEKVRSMVGHEKEKYGWEFIFLGADMDAVGAAADIGIPPERSARFNKTARSNASMYDCVCDAVSAVRCDAPISAGWSAGIIDDGN